MRLEKLIPPLGIGKVIFPIVMRAPINSSAKADNFLIEYSWFAAVFHKVKLHLTAVNMTVEIHNHCLCSTAIHNTDNMQHSDWFIHTFASYPCISSS